jgi:Tfp pilus assembly protein PilZ
MRNLTPWGIAFLLMFSSCIKKNKPLTREEVVEVIRKFDEGWRSKNLARVDSVLAPRYIYFTQSGGLFVRDSVVQTAGSSAYSLENMIRSDYEVELVGQTAVVSTRWQGKGVYRGVPFDEDQRCSLTIIKDNNKVMILSEHCTPIRNAAIFH